MQRRTVFTNCMTDHDSVERADGAPPRPTASARALEGALATWGASGDQIDAEAALARVTRERLRIDLGHTPPGMPVVGSVVTRPTPWLRIAAALVVLIGGGLLLARVTAPRVASQMYATTVGTRQTVTLREGTVVTLGPDSRLRVREGFGASHRDVELEGEAWFKVTHDDGKPFTTVIGGTRVVDVGTAFLVRGTESGVSVQVAEGAVRVEPAAAPSTKVNLAAGDAVRLAGDSVLVSRGTVDAAAAESMTRGALVFRDASMSEVTHAMRRWFGVELVIPDAALLRKHLTANFSAEPRDRVLSVLALTLGASIETRGDSAIVRVKETVPDTR
jgi:transmembrane sensor